MSRSVKIMLSHVHLYMAGGQFQLALPKRCEVTSTLRIRFGVPRALLYRMAGKFGGEFNLADWRMNQRTAKLNSAKFLVLDVIFFPIARKNFSQTRRPGSLVDVMPSHASINGQRGEFHIFDT